MLLKIGMVALVGALLAVLLGGPAESSVLAAWTQFGPGEWTARAIVSDGACPSIRFDDASVEMLERAAPSADFAVRSCEALIPRAAKRVRIADRELPVPRATVRTIAVIGDTGCRIKFPVMQSCNDPSAWPFAAIARRVAAAHPDLIVHVGDYYYRESPCVVVGCSNSPHGDAWPSWEADFFDAAAPLFASAPLVLVRGNHESCKRGGEGWDRFLSPYPRAACTDLEPTYTVALDRLRLVVIDSSDASDLHASDPVVAKYREALAPARARSEAPAWLLSHRPLWAIEGVPIVGGTVALNETLQAAALGRDLPIAMAISGHVHLFEALRFADRRAPQFVVGVSGDALSRMPATIVGAKIDGTTVSGGAIDDTFGYAIVDRAASTMTAFDRNGTSLNVCRFASATVSCAREAPSRSPASAGSSGR